MFTRDPLGDAPQVEPRPYLMACVFLALVGTIYFGLFPDLALEFARDSFAMMR
jgi:hypothetical protein